MFQRVTFEWVNKKLDMDYYAIINGQQVGPVGESQLLGIGVTPGTMVWRAGMVQWQPAGSLPELAHLFGNAPPPMPGQWPGAIAGLVLGICSIYFCAPVVGLLLGYFGLLVTKDSYKAYQTNPTQYSGGGVLKVARIVSQVGFVLGIIVTAISFLVILFYILMMLGVVGSLSALPFVLDETINYI